MADSFDVRFKHLRSHSPSKPNDEVTNCDQAADRQFLDLEPLTGPEEHRKGSSFSRRSFLSGLGATSLLAGAAPLAAAAPVIEPEAGETAAVDGASDLTLRINGKDYRLRDLDPRASPTSKLIGLSQLGSSSGVNAFAIGSCCLEVSGWRYGRRCFQGAGRPACSDDARPPRSAVIKVESPGTGEDTRGWGHRLLGQKILARRRISCPATQ